MIIAARSCFLTPHWWHGDALNYIDNSEIEKMRISQPRLPIMCLSAVLLPIWVKIGRLEVVAQPCR